MAYDFEELMEELAEGGNLSLAVDKHDRGEITPESIANVTVDIVLAAVKTTCAVYLRPECVNCQFDRLMNQHPKFLKKNIGILEKGEVNQYFRQMVIWAKDSTEEEMKEPCTGETVRKILHGE